MLKILIKTRLLALLTSFSQLGQGQRKKNQSLATVLLVTLLLGGVIAASVGVMFWGFGQKDKKNDQIFTSYCCDCVRGNGKFYNAR